MDEKMLSKHKISSLQVFLSLYLMKDITFYITLGKIRIFSPKSLLLTFLSNIRHAMKLFGFCKSLQALQKKKKCPGQKLKRKNGTWKQLVWLGRIRPVLALLMQGLNNKILNRRKISRVHQKQTFKCHLNAVQN